MKTAETESNKESSEPKKSENKIRMEEEKLENDNRLLS